MVIVPISGYKTLYLVNYWGWDGSSREIDYYTGDIIEQLLTVFIYAFWEDEDLLVNFEEITGAKSGKIESTRRATDEEEAAFNSGWLARDEHNNGNYGKLD